MTHLDADTESKIDTYVKENNVFVQATWDRVNSTIPENQKVAAEKKVKDSYPKA